MIFRNVLIRTFLALFLFQTGCATQTKNIAASMLVGAGVGAVVGQQFDSHNDPGVKTNNVIVSSVLTALLAGGLMAWHYQDIESETEKISGNYARMRLCEPNELPPKVGDEFDLDNSDQKNIYPIQEKQVGELAIFLDDNTKWAYPTFRKRYLLPELGETQMTSERYIWEILKPGTFVTRSQNPYYFFETKKK